MTLLLILLVSWAINELDTPPNAIVCAKAEQCVARKYDQESIVCVCNATYCDLIEPTTVDQLAGNVARHYISTIEGLRLEPATLHFSTETLDIANATYFQVNKNVTYQQILGFGGAMTDSAAIHINSLSEEAQNLLLSAYFSPEGLEYSFVRVPIGGSDFSTHYYAYDDVANDSILRYFNLTEEDYLFKIPNVKRAQSLSNGKVKPFTTAWSAPDWMKNIQTNGRSSLKPEYYQLWANYYIKFLDAYAVEDIRFWGLTPQNEPSHGNLFYSGFNSMGWTADQQLEWVVGNLAPTLEENGYSDLELMILDDQRIFLNAWVDTIFQNETANKVTSGVAIHWYLDILSSANHLDTAHEAFPDKFLLYTEACITHISTQVPVYLGSWSRGERYMSSIIEVNEVYSSEKYKYVTVGTYKVTNHWVVGWVDWNLVLDLDGGPNWANNTVDSPIIVNATANEFYKQPMFYALAHFSKFVPPGSVHISLETENNSNFIENVAFVTEDGLKVIILQNKGYTNQSVVIRDADKGDLLVEAPSRSMHTIIYI